MSFDLTFPFLGIGSAGGKPLFGAGPQVQREASLGHLLPGASRADVPSEEVALFGILCGW